MLNENMLNKSVTQVYILHATTKTDVTEHEKAQVKEHEILRTKQEERIRVGT